MPYFMSFVPSIKFYWAAKRATKQKSEDAHRTFAFTNSNFNGSFKKRREKYSKQLPGTKTAGTLSKTKILYGIERIFINVDFKPLTLHVAVGHTTLLLLLPH